jgi:hypothetical protein
MKSIITICGILFSFNVAGQFYAFKSQDRLKQVDSLRNIIGGDITAIPSLLIPITMSPQLPTFVYNRVVKARSLAV